MSDPLGLAGTTTTPRRRKAAPKNNRVVAPRDFTKQANAGDFGVGDGIALAFDNPSPGFSVDFGGPVDPTSDAGYQAFLRAQGVQAGHTSELIAERLDKLNRGRERTMQDRDLAILRAEQDANLRLADRENAANLRQTRGQEDLDLRQRIGNRNINQNLESRGLFRSSQRMADLSELEREIVKSETRLGQDTNRELTDAREDRRRGFERVSFDDARFRARFGEDFQRQLDAIEEAKAKAGAGRASARRRALAAANRRQFTNRGLPASRFLKLG